MRNFCSWDLRHCSQEILDEVLQFTCHLLQVSQDGKSLLDKLQRPLTPGSADSLMASANYSKAVHHVLDIIHEVLHHQRQLENIWQHRKVRLHQRLQLCVFQQDVQQVRDKYRHTEQSPTTTRPAALWALHAHSHIHSEDYSRDWRKCCPILPLCFS